MGARVRPQHVTPAQPIPQLPHVRELERLQPGPDPARVQHSTRRRPGAGWHGRPRSVHRQRCRRGAGPDRQLPPPGQQRPEGLRCRRHRRRLRRQRRPHAHTPPNRDAHANAHSCARDADATRTPTPVPATPTRTPTPVPATPTRTRTPTPYPRRRRERERPLPYPRRRRDANAHSVPATPTRTRTPTPVPATPTRTPTPNATAPAIVLDIDGNGSAAALSDGLFRGASGVRAAAGRCRAPQANQAVRAATPPRSRPTWRRLPICSTSTGAARSATLRWAAGVALVERRARRRARERSGHARKLHPMHGDQDRGVLKDLS